MKHQILKKTHLFVKLSFNRTCIFNHQTLKLLIIGKSCKCCDRLKIAIVTMKIRENLKVVNRKRQTNFQCCQIYKSLIFEFQFEH